MHVRYVMKMKDLNYTAICSWVFESNQIIFTSKWKEIAISRINRKVEGNSSFKIAISFHSLFFEEFKNGRK